MPKVGFKHSEEAKRKVKETWAKKRADGYASPHRGSKLSEEHKKKNKETRRGLGESFEGQKAYS